MFTGEYVLLRSSLLIATAKEVDEKATTDLYAALYRTKMTKMLATTDVDDMGGGGVRRG
jgi:hypothetical protein